MKLNLSDVRMELDAITGPNTEAVIIVAVTGNEVRARTYGDTRIVRAALDQLADEFVNAEPVDIRPN